MIVRTLSLLAACVAVAAGQSGAIRMIRSLSGPSGKVVGTKFVLSETRSRFVFPQDKSLVVYFEWDAPPGSHVLTAMWKGPGGHISSMSPDVKVETSARELKCSWTYVLTDGMGDGIWPVEVRVDGQPAGTHPFEITGTAKAVPAPPPPAPRLPTVDEIFRDGSPSLVWVHKLDDQGRRADTASGFVIGKDRIATAFQAIDCATRVRVEFAGGRAVDADGVLAFSRTQDWAVLKADTADAPSLGLGDPGKIAVGERLIVFTVEGGARIIGGIDVAGRRNVPGFGPRIQLTPSLAQEAAGGPLLNTAGLAVGILGGSLTPGGRSGRLVTNVSPALWQSIAAQFAAVPISLLPADLPVSGSKLADLLASGKLTPPIAPMQEFLYGGTAQFMPKNAADPLPPTVTDFSRKDPRVWVYTVWEQKGKLSKGMLSATIYDEQNRVRGNVPPMKISLSNAYKSPIRSAFSFGPAPLDAGVYRIDLMWDGRPVWRTFIRITD